jgi:hypothetical protein
MDASRPQRQTSAGGLVVDQFDGEAAEFDVPDDGAIHNQPDSAHGSPPCRGSEEVEVAQP